MSRTLGITRSGWGNLTLRGERGRGIASRSDLPVAVSRYRERRRG